jgi:hypothetical protein
MISPTSAKTPSPDSLDTLISLMSEISHAMSRMSTDVQALVRQDLAALKKLTEQTHSQQMWKGWQTVCLTAFSGSLAVFGSCIPTGWGATDLQEFVATTAKTTARFFEGGVSPANDARHNAQLSTLQSNRELVKMYLDQEQGAESGYDAMVRKLHEMASGILQAAR